MTKYKVVGLINIFFGVIQLLASASQLYLNIQLGNLYREFNVQAGTNLIVAKIGLALLLALALINLYLGATGLSQSKQKEVYLKRGIISAITSLAISVFVIIFLIVTIILPIYSLNQQF